MGLPASLRQLALEDLLGRLAYIQVLKGYNTDAGLNIFAGEAPRFGEDDPDTALLVEVLDDAPSQEGGLIRTTVPVRIWACVPTDAQEPLVAVEAMLADIKTAVEQGTGTDRTLGAVGVDPATVPGAGIGRGVTSALRRPEGSQFAGAAITYTLTFVEHWGGGGR